MCPRLHQVPLPHRSRPRVHATPQVGVVETWCPATQPTTFWVAFGQAVVPPFSPCNDALRRFGSMSASLRFDFRPLWASCLHRESVLSTGQVPFSGSTTDPQVVLVYSWAFRHVTERPFVFLLWARISIMQDLLLWHYLRQPVLPPASTLLPLLEELAQEALNHRLPFFSLYERIASHPDAVVRAAGVRALAGAYGFPALRSLVAALADSTPAVRLAAVDSLQVSASADPAQWVHALYHSDPAVRRGPKSSGRLVASAPFSRRRALSRVGKRMSCRPWP